MCPQDQHTCHIKNFPKPVVLELRQQRTEDSFKVKVNKLVYMAKEKGWEMKGGMEGGMAGGREGKWELPHDRTEISLKNYHTKFYSVLFLRKTNMRTSAIVSAGKTHPTKT